MKSIIIGSTKHLAFALFYSSIGTCIALIVAAVWYLNSRPALDLWHTTELEAQYRQQPSVVSFKDYLRLEDKLFAEVERKVSSKTTSDSLSVVNRYVSGSYSDPNKWQRNWNRSFEWKNEHAKYGILLLHGMSDSPYAMQYFAKHYKASAHVLGLRLPGHGTLPSGLTDIKWQDMAAAVSIAVRHMQQVMQDKPLYVVGFSTGAALALNHELENLMQGDASDFSGLVFVSPAIGLPPVAAGAKWQARLGHFLGLDKLSWNSIQTEYDPFKYSSFAVNAGDVVYQLASRNVELLNQLDSQSLAQLAPMLTFQSLTDDTVDTMAVLCDLYLQLPDNNHELVMFDINRTQVNLSLMPTDPLLPYFDLVDTTEFNFDFTLIENTGEERGAVQARNLTNGTDIETIAQHWPKQVYSLSHVALPFPEADELYGPHRIHNGNRVQIGAGASKGERGVLSVPPSEVLRQKWNPFFGYMLDKMDGVITD
ncbi:alpha/beta fold hydrolase [Shewanella abyssi]|uniref:alpha/beta hydrolase n=1 Tax=Shewanella abyssi TaxID=311789 RepID=UPI00200ECF0A|nr:alpha/beta fold hydrolase [Shewanella abyssi]MCL1049185.1 alpha/beta fold hydrolase [Shewanella abyssi]